MSRGVEKMLQTFRADLHGIMAVAHATGRIQLIERALDHAEFARANSQLIALAHIATDHDVSVAGWRDLLSLIVETSIRANDTAPLMEVFDTYMWLGWKSAPWALSSGLALAHHLTFFHTGAALGDLLSRHYPDFALGPYASAHFREMEMGATWGKEGGRPSAVVERFERAASLAAHSNRPDLARHCKLRAGVVSLRDRTDPSGGRAALKAIETDALSCHELCWWALGMQHSEFWLDRVRALDTLDEIAHDVVTARPGEASRLFSVPQIERIVTSVISSQAEMEGAVEDRLRGLISTTFSQGREGRGDTILSMLSARSVIAREGHVYAASALDGLASLEERMRPLTPQWAEAFASARALARALAPHDASYEEKGGAESESAWLEGSAYAARLLNAVRRDDGRDVVRHLGEVEALLRTSPARAHLAPLSAAWPALMEWIGEKTKARKSSGGVDLLSEEVEQGEEEWEYIEERVEDVMALWGAVAPVPSYGWWALAAHLAHHGLYRAAHVIGCRGGAAHQEPERATARFVVGGLMAWAVDLGDRGAMRHWLEQAERLEKERV